jgi:hypothetical protein
MRFHALCTDAACSHDADDHQVNTKMREADDDWGGLYGGGRHPYAQNHATEQSAAYKRYVTDAVAEDAPPPPPAAAAAADDDGAAGPSDAAAAADDDDVAPAALDADVVVAELRALFTAAKGLSLSVLMASRLQERRGNAQRLGIYPDNSDDGGSDPDGFE